MLTNVEHPLIEEYFIEKVNSRFCSHLRVRHRLNLCGNWRYNLYYIHKIFLAMGAFTCKWDLIKTKLEPEGKDLETWSFHVAGRQFIIMVTPCAALAPVYAWCGGWVGLRFGNWARIPIMLLEKTYNGRHFELCSSLERWFVQDTRSAVFWRIRVDAPTKGLRVDEIPS